MKSVVTLLWVVVASLTTTTAQQAIKFEKGKWNDALTKAKAENKLVFVDAYTTWCGPCKWLAKNVFTNDTVAQFYNSRFVNVSIDMEKGEGIELAKQWEIRAYPTLLYINSSGEMVHRVSGAAPAPQFIKTGEDALNMTSSLYADMRKYREGNADAEFLAAYVKRLYRASMPYKEVAQKYFQSQRDEELNNERNWKMIMDFTDDLDSREFRYLLKNRPTFEEKYTKEAVDKKLTALYSDYLFLSIVTDTGSSRYPVAKAKIQSIAPDMAAGFYSMTDKRYYKKKKDWQNFALATEQLVEASQSNWSLLNAAAWDFYETVDDHQKLEKALGWVKKSLALNTNYFNSDTYAALLFKLGRKAEAKEEAEKAIALAKAAKEDYSATSDLLKQIKKMK